VKLPGEFLDSLNGLKGFDREEFIKVHDKPESITSIRINPKKKSNIEAGKSRVPWTEYGFYLEERPSFTFDPLFHAGCYYVQEASSMFIEQAFRQLTDLSQPLKVLDLSASPGGKSTHIQSLISEHSLLVSNEVIKSRVQPLTDNIIKWGASNVMVTQNDPKNFEALGNYFDVVVVDAPCSGSGLFRRDPSAIDEWSLNNVQLCSQRQQRILADAWKCLKQDGLLVYSTCSYSREEDENILSWLCTEFPVQGMKLELDRTWNISEVKLPGAAYGYRFWPDKIRGEGFFICCLQKTGREEEMADYKRRKIEKLNAIENEEILKWLEPKGWELIKSGKLVYAWPSTLSDDFNFLLKHLRVNYSGVMAGEFIREKFIPSHELALSKGILSDEIESVSLEKTQAINYLRKVDAMIDVKIPGWKIVSYEGQNLGWINVLANRINNYYPKALRILKDPKNNDISK
jgi:16S rRNA C967 or C1407 C5-methylase (RsmB/RsmF family)/NOL1/NOP2/fmu family ribosome biogenesis protein